MVGRASRSRKRRRGDGAVTDASGAVMAVVQATCAARGPHLWPTRVARGFRAPRSDLGGVRQRRVRRRRSARRRQRGSLHADQRARRGGRGTSAVVEVPGDRAQSGWALAGHVLRQEARSRVAAERARSRRTVSSPPGGQDRRMNRSGPRRVTRRVRSVACRLSPRARTFRRCYGESRSWRWHWRGPPGWRQSVGRRDS